jgi:hypothetical protein
VKNFGSFTLAIFIAAQFSFAQESPPDTTTPPTAELEKSLQEAPVTTPVAAEPAPVESTTVPLPKPVVAEPEPVAAETAMQTTTAFVEEPSEIPIGLGLRLGLGASNYRHHKKVEPSDPTHRALKLQPAFALSVGLALQIGLSKGISISPELQYSLYRANNELKLEDKNSKNMSRLYEVGVYTHALELPVQLRFNLNDAAYLEFGPQVGLNLYSKVYKNADYYRPDLNLFTFGIAGGAGFNLSGILVGVRVYSSVLEYANDNDTKGFPWSVQFSITPYIF